MEGESGFTSPIFVCSDPSSNLTHIKEVSDWILKAKLPIKKADLERKLEELKNLTAILPDSTAVLKTAEPLLARARKLMKEAQDARLAFTLPSHCRCFYAVFSNKKCPLNALITLLFVRLVIKH